MFSQHVKLVKSVKDVLLASCENPQTFGMMTVETIFLGSKITNPLGENSPPVVPRCPPIFPVCQQHGGMVKAREGPARGVWGNEETVWDKPWFVRRLWLLNYLREFEHVGATIFFGSTPSLAMVFGGPW